VAEIVSLGDAVEGLVRDGDVVALEGFTHLIPHAAGHEIVRRGRRDLALIRMTPDVVYDQLIGMGCARKLVFSWGGNPRRRLAAPPARRRRELLAATARARGTFPRWDGGGVRRRRGQPPVRRPARVRGDGARRTHFHGRSDHMSVHGEELAAVPAHRPDVGVIHAQQADRVGNVQLWGIPGVQKEVVLASQRSIATVEEIVDVLEPRPGGVVLPGWVVDAVAVAPGGSLVRARVLRAGQRLLRALGRGQPRPRPLHCVDAAACAGHCGRR
jgi:glutaconate CoA-transferase subunit A